MDIRERRGRHACRERRAVQLVISVQDQARVKILHELGVRLFSRQRPKEIVSELDKHIVGQASAKRSVAIALRNRWRRQQVDSALRDEITPKNILMIGPTGVGKTEIARRLARLANAPFIKIEAT